MLTLLVARVVPVTCRHLASELPSGNSALGSRGRQLWSSGVQPWSSGISQTPSTSIRVLVTGRQIRSAFNVSK